jgi:hypothetical protein
MARKMNRRRATETRVQHQSSADIYKTLLERTEYFKISRESYEKNNCCYHNMLLTAWNKLLKYKRK